MENIIAKYENLLWGIFSIVIGIGCLAYMKYDKKTRTKESEDYKYLIDKSVRLNLYIGGYFAVIVGIFIILNELFS